MGEISEIEESAAEAWPAAVCVRLGEWRMRHGDGFTGRANSVLPLGEPVVQLEEAIETARRFYASRGLPTQFKLTAASLPGSLDSVLEGLGAEVRQPSLVMRAAVGAWPVPSAVWVDSSPSSRWMDAYEEVHGWGQRRAATLVTLSQMRQARFVTVLDGDEPAACGILSAGWIFNLATHAGKRRRGFGTAVLAALHGEARRLGCSEVRLQVLAENPGALRLYESFGYETAYPYWYRSLPD